jgi:hypothetical protein
VRDFPRYFGDAPIRDIGLLATEGRVSIPFEDGTPAGLLDVTAHFFEFIDAESNDPSPSTLLCHELSPGRTYRVIMTTSAGFYRYDLGDHVRVHGYVGQTPIIEFLHRGAYVSSLTGEKLTEWQVTHAYERACQLVAMTSSLFVLAPVWGDPPHYQLQVDEPAPETDGLIRSFDAELQSINVEYRSKRTSNRLGPVQLKTLPIGELTRLDALRQRRAGPANEQFKHRYLLSHPVDEPDVVNW